MSYEQKYFGGTSQTVDTFDNVERTYTQSYFGATSGAQNLSLWDQPRAKPATAKIKTVGKTQISTDDGATWRDTFPAGYLKAGEPVDFLIRTNPTALDEPDDGTYEYDFKMATVGAGGLNLVNTDVNKAHITGTTPADQVGITFSVNCTVVDKYGTSKTGSATTQTWVAP